MVALRQASHEPAAYPRVTDAAEIRRRCRPETWEFYQYWDGKRIRPDGSRRLMPARRDIDPLEMVKWLPNIQLVDVFHNPLRLVYRLVGETEIYIRGYNPTGRSVEECAIGKDIADPLGNYDIVVNKRLPVFDWSNLTHPGGYMVTQECILLPLSDDGKTVNMVLTFAWTGSALP